MCICLFNSSCILKIPDLASLVVSLTASGLQVCKLRALPIFTFVNKMDRPSLSPYELLDQIEKEFGIQMAPILWPIGDGERFQVML